MPAVIPLVIAGASAAGQIYSAKKGASAAKTAAATQSASADKALELQRQAYEQQRQNLAPYRALGEGSLQNLGNFQSFAGVPGNFGAGVQSQYQHALSPNYSMPPQGPLPGAAPQMGGRTNPNGQPIVDYAVQRGTLANPQGTMLRAPQAGQMVQMRAPTGEVMPVERSQVEHYMQRGATVVNQ